MIEAPPNEGITYYITHYMGKKQRYLKVEALFHSNGTEDF